MMEIKDTYVTKREFDARFDLSDLTFREAMERIDKRFVQFEKRFDDAMARIDVRFDKLEKKISEGFDTMFNLCEKLDAKTERLSIEKADREETLSLHRRVTKLEEKLA